MLKCLERLEVFVKVPFGASHWEVEPQNVLAHQVTHGVISQETRKKSKDAARLLQSERGVGVAVGRREIGRCNKHKGQLDGSKDRNVDKIAIHR